MKHVHGRTRLLALVVGLMLLGIAAPAEAAPGLTVALEPLRADQSTVVGPGDRVLPGEAIVYRAIASNPGDAATGPISVAVTLPARDRLQSASADAAGWTLVTDPAPGGTSTGSLADLQPGESRSFLLVAAVSAASPEGEVGSAVANAGAAGATAATTTGFVPGVEATSPATVAAASPSTANELVFTVANAGNGADRFSVAVAAADGLAVSGYRAGGTTYGTLAALNAGLDAAPVAAGGTVGVTVVYTVAAGQGGATLPLTLTASSARGVASSSATTDVEPPPSAGVSVTPDGAAVARVPGQSTQGFTVTNTGNATDTFTLSPGTSDPSVVSGATAPATVTLAAGEQATVTVGYTVAAGAAPRARGDVVLLATSQRDATKSDQGSAAVTVARPAVSTDVAVFRDDATTAVGAGDLVRPGEYLSLLVTLRNSGDAPAVVQAASLALPDGDAYVSATGDAPGWTISGSAATATASLASLPAGTSRSFRVRFRVAAGASEGDERTLVVGTVFSDANGNPYDATSDTASFTPGFGAGVDVVAGTAGHPASPSAGNLARFTVTNAGNGTDTLDVFNVSLAPGLTLERLRLEGRDVGTLAALRAELATTPVAAGGSLEVEVVYGVLGGRSGQTLPITLRARSGRDTSVTDSATLSSVAAFADLTVTPDSGDVSRLPGGSYSQTFSVRNGGNVADTVALTPDVSDASLVPWVSSPQTVSVAPGATEDVEVTYSLATGAEQGATATVSLRAVTGIDASGESDDGAITVAVVRPVVGATLSVLRDDGTTPVGSTGTVVPGEHLRYAITLTNSGDAPAAGLEAVHVLPSRDAYVSASGDAAGWDVSEGGGAVTAQLATLAAGETRSLVVRVRVGGDAPEGATGASFLTATFSDENANPYAAVNASAATTNGFLARVDVQGAANRLAFASATGSEATFTVANGGNGTDGVTLALAAGSGVTVTGYRLDGSDLPTLAAVNTALATRDLAPGSSAALTVVYSVPLWASGRSVPVTLTGTSRRTPATSGAATTALDVREAGVDVTTDAGTVARIPGDSTLYTQQFTVRNTGTAEDAIALTAAASDPSVAVIATVDGAGGSSATVTVPAGEARTVDVVYVVPSWAATGATSSLSLTAVSGNLASRTDSAAKIVSAVRPTLTATAAVLRDDGATVVRAGDRVVPGELIRYAVTVKNVGNAPASGLLVVGSLPDRDRYESASGAGWDLWQSGNAVQGALPALDAGASRTFMVQARVGESSGEGDAPSATVVAYYNDANATSYPSVTASATATTGFVADLDATGDPRRSAFASTTGNEAPFTIVNAGNGLDRVSVSAEAPDGLTVTGYRHDGTVYPSANALNMALASAQLLPGAAVAVSVLYSPAADAAGRTFPLTLTSASRRAPATTSVATTEIEVLGAGVSVTPASVSVSRVPGGSHAERFTVRNTGDATDTIALSATSSDPGVAAVWSVGGTPGGSAWVTVEPGDAMPVDLVYTMPAEAADGARATLTFSATSANDAAKSDTGTATVRVVRPEVSATLTAYRDDGTTRIIPGDRVVPGEHVKHVVRLKNVGSAPATGIIVSHALPPRDVFVSGEGEGWTVSEYGGSVSGSLAALAPQETRSFTIRTLVHETVLEDTDAEHKLTAWWSDAGGGTYPPATATTLTTTGFRAGASVEAVPVVTPTSPSSGNATDFTLVNTGNGTDRLTVATTAADGIAVTGYRVGDTTYHDVSALNAMLAGRQLVANEALPVTVLYDVAPERGGQSITLTVAAASRRTPEATGSATTTVMPLAEIVPPDPGTTPGYGGGYEDPGGTGGAGAYPAPADPGSSYAPGPGADPVAPAGEDAAGGDEKPNPRVRVSGRFLWFAMPAKQVAGRSVRFAVACLRTCALTARGVILVYQRGTRGAIRSLPLPDGTYAVRRGGGKALTLQIPARERRALRRIFQRRRRVKVVISVVAREESGAEHTLKARSRLIG